jgi:hypothetical protein
MINNGIVYKIYVAIVDKHQTYTYDSYVNKFCQQLVYYRGADKNKDEFSVVMTQNNNRNNLSSKIVKKLISMGCSVKATMNMEVSSNDRVVIITEKTNQTGIFLLYDSFTDMVNKEQIYIAFMED